VTRAQRAIVVAVIAVIAGRVSGAAAQGASQTLGFVQHGRYHHVKTGVQFLVPLDWMVGPIGPGAFFFIRVAAADLQRSSNRADGAHAPPSGSVQRFTRAFTVMPDSRCCRSRT
jgi:hypothetical protein